MSASDLMIVIAFASLLVDVIGLIIIIILAIIDKK